MSIAERAALYQEQTAKKTPHEDVDRGLAELNEGKRRLQSTPIPELIHLARECLDGMVRHSGEWVDAACQAKSVAVESAMGGEEVSAGPLAAARHLQLLMTSLADIDRHGVPQLPSRPVSGPNGRLRVPVMPTKGLFDSIAFSGFKAHVWQQDGITRENLAEHQAHYYRTGRDETGIACVLGAGNVSSIAPTDAFHKIFTDGKVVLLKMNPVNEYLGPIFEKAFAPLIEADFLKIVYGGTEVGGYALGHDAVDEVHITGSVFSHETIVWGPPGPERERRKSEKQPLLEKEITSELGNVSPWIVLPGPYTEKELRFQAENLASSIVNNGSFNCVATKAILTWKDWKDRGRFLNMVQEVLDTVPQRKAYYPGARERFCRFTGTEPAAGPGGTLPWTVVRDVDPEKDPLFFDEESFVCVTAETALGAKSETSFAEQAVEFANDRLYGSLGATLIVHPQFKKSHPDLFDSLLTNLRFGSIGVNYWSALAYAMMSPPWGGYPGATIESPGSGIGWVHNTYMLDGAEKTVLEGPLTQPLKPLWFPSHKNAATAGWKVVDLYDHPSVWKLPGLLLAAIRG